MHIQARAKPSKSPANLADFLGELAADVAMNRDAINVEGVSGSAVEGGGELAFTVTHGRAREANDRLTSARYRVEWTKDLYAEEIPPVQDTGSGPAVPPDDADPNQPGVLLGIVQRAKGSSLAGGRDIDTVLIGAFTDRPGHYFAQITFHGSDWREDAPEQDD